MGLKYIAAFPICFFIEYAFEQTNGVFKLTDSKGGILVGPHKEG